MEEGLRVPARSCAETWALVDAGIGILVRQIVGVVAVKPVRGGGPLFTSSGILSFFNFGDFGDSAIFRSLSAGFWAFTVQPKAAAQSANKSVSS